MFLIEGQGKAILYTGDIRAEPWFVNSLARNPAVLEYTCGLKILDKLYLDTSFLEDIPFQTKSEGIAELLAKVQKYPKDTTFHLQAWTFGYEDVWIALSKALSSRIHVDDYKLRIFNSLKSRSSDQQFAQEYHLASGAAMLTGHMCGNTQHLGCLTSDTNVRIHSCEKANMCSVAKHPSVVSIRPVVCRLPGGEAIMEAGVGGGGTDFSREAELHWITDDDIDVFLHSLPEWDEVNDSVKDKIKTLLTGMSSSGRDLSLNMDIEDFGDDLSADMGFVIQSLAERLRNKSGNLKPPANTRPDGLPKVILFPFARHSPYRELCHLAEAFKPKDIWPCTVDRYWMENMVTIESLFGKYCSERLFEHDKQMAPFMAQQLDMRSREVKTPDRDTQQSKGLDTSQDLTPKVKRTRDGSDRNLSQQTNVLAEEPSTQNIPESNAPAEDCHAVSTTRPEPEPTTPQARHPSADTRPQAHSDDKPTTPPRKRQREEAAETECRLDACGSDSQMTDLSVGSSSASFSVLRQDAYDAMLSNSNGDEPWVPISLLSADGHHHDTEVEL
ncbi:artemis protein [Pochonia chlamydosporia 170]|uniref:Artemis protein n=1 Tax=Pochonia chlamydosporia 170 TaxID=1380566 RepID=A0A179G8W1_METCM|nr:artemis protein [Pochonia chlamydosporia 170]OAQ74242.2 artemis protein [Pochonia chlamydosporia 170]